MRKRIFSELVLKWLGERSVRQGALLLNVVDNTVHAWIAGDSLPPATKISSLSQAFGIAEDELRDAIRSDRASRHASDSTVSGNA